MNNIVNEINDNLKKIYLSAFMRSPELDGFNYWMDKYNKEGVSFNDIVSIIFSLDSVKVLYPDTMLDAEFVEAIYQNVFGRNSDTEGLAYWVNELQVNRNHFISEGHSLAVYEARGMLANAMVNAGLGAPDGVDGKAYIEHRMNFSNIALSQQILTQENLDPLVLTREMSYVNESSSSLVAAQDDLFNVIALNTQSDDMMSPMFINGKVIGSQAFLNFSENIVIPQNFSLNSFRVMFSGSIVGITSIESNGSGITLNLNQPVQSNHFVTFNYASDGISFLGDISGNSVGEIYNAPISSEILNISQAYPPLLKLAHDTGSFQDDDITNIGWIQVIGIIQGYTWEYSTNQGVTWIQGDGNRLLIEKEGEYSIVARQISPNGTTTQSSSALDFILDTTAPEDVAGNNAASFSAQTVVNNTPPALLRHLYFNRLR